MVVAHRREAISSWGSQTKAFRLIPKMTALLCTLEKNLRPAMCDDKARGPHAPQHTEHAKLWRTYSLNKACLSSALSGASSKLPFSLWVWGRGRAIHLLPVQDLHVAGDAVLRHCATSHSTLQPLDAFLVRCCLHFELSCAGLKNKWETESWATASQGRY